MSSLEQRWRSLESSLIKHSRKYECNDINGFATVEVVDTSDAILLAGLLSINKFEYISNEGKSSVIDIVPIKHKTGRKRLKDMVFLNGDTVGITMHEHTRELRIRTLSKSTIIKQGILTKSQLEHAITSRDLKTIRVGKSTRVDRDELTVYLDHLYALRNKSPNKTTLSSNTPTPGKLF